MLVAAVALFGSVASWVVASLTSRDVVEPVLAVLGSVCFLWFLVLVGVPVRIRFGAMWSIIAMALALAAVLAAASLLPLTSDAAPAVLVARLMGGLVALLLLSAPISYVVSQRWYARKDL